MALNKHKGKIFNKNLFKLLYLIKRFTQANFIDKKFTKISAFFRWEPFMFGQDFQIELVLCATKKLRKKSKKKKLLQS